MPPRNDEFEDAPGASEMFRKYGLADRDQAFEDFCEKLADEILEFSNTVGLIEESSLPKPADLEELASAEKGVREFLRSAPPEWVSRASARLQAGGPFCGSLGIDFAASFNETTTRRMLARAVADCSEGSEVSPAALNNWGNALCDQAEQMTGAEADALFAQAGEKYEAALKIKPDLHQALCNWGKALLAQARRKTGVEAGALIQLAEQKFDISESISPGSSAYNLACLASLRGTPTAAKRWLQTCRDLEKLPNRNHMEEDSDLDAIRSEEWFREFLEN